MADRSHSPVKVAIFMEFFLPYLGGIERYQDRLSEQLRLLGYDVFIVTSLHDESLPRFEDKDGLRIYRLPTKACSSSVTPSLSATSVSRKRWRPSRPRTRTSTSSTRAST